MEMEMEMEMAQITTRRMESPYWKYRVKGNRIKMKPNKWIMIWTNHKYNHPNNDGFMKYNKSQDGETTKEATTRSGVQFYIKVAGVVCPQEEAKHYLATTL